jgi:hypothetical protein
MSVLGVVCIILAIGIVMQNAVWIYLLREYLMSDSNETTPSAAAYRPPRVEDEESPSPLFDSPQNGSHDLSGAMSRSEQMEFAAVGQIDPQLERKEDD